MKTFQLSVAVTAAIMATASASHEDFQKRRIRDVYVMDFYSSEPKSCTTSDVDLNPAQVAAFFKRSKVIGYKTLIDNYPIAPCYIMGTLKYKGKLCDWEILAGATGSISCDGQEWYFACDACKDLFPE